MTCTASADSGTGDPIPISCPVSRGNSFRSTVAAEVSDGKVEDASGPGLSLSGVSGFGLTPTWN